MDSTNPPQYPTSTPAAGATPSTPASSPASDVTRNLPPDQPGAPSASAEAAQPAQPAQPAQWPNAAAPQPPASGAAVAPEASPAWPTYPPPPAAYPIYPGDPGYPGYGPPPQSQPYQKPYEQTYQSPPTSYAPYQGNDAYYQQQYPYSNWVPGGGYRGRAPSGYPGVVSASNEIRRHLRAAKEWGQVQFQRVRVHPQSRYAALALVLLFILVVGVAIGGALTHAATSTTTSSGTTIGASSPPITSVPPAAQDLQQTLIDTVNAVEPSVVEVTSSGSGNGQAIGSGEILTSDGYIVTNDHVVEGFSSFSVRLSNGQTMQARLVGKDAQDDLAVLKASLSDAKPIAFADSDKVQVGSFAIALGSPLGLQDSVTFGVVSALNRTASEAPDGPAGTLTGLIQTSAPINPGNSGGALVDLQGQLIGIPTLGATDNETGGIANGIGFAIASNRVKYVSQQLIANGQVTSSGQGFLGIQGQDVSPQSGSGGADVTGVQIAGFSNDASGKSPAQSAGMQIGDIITAVDGQPVVSGDDLAAALQTKQPGTKVTIQFVRGSSQQTATVTLGERPIQSQG